MKISKAQWGVVIAAVGVGVLQWGDILESKGLIFTGTVLFLFGIFKFLGELLVKRDADAIERALRDYDTILDGVRWIGRDAKVLDWYCMRQPDDRGRVRVHQICRTQKGAWFGFEVVVMDGRILERTLRPYTESQAQFQLQGNQDVYARLFGKPTIA